MIRHPCALSWMAVAAAVAAVLVVTDQMTTTPVIVVVSAYTFDPLNNMWKPSGAKTARRSSFASSYAPHPSSELEAPPVFEDEVIRAQYSTWAGHYHNGEDKEHGESFQQTSMVQIEYNKRTGEVSLMDHDGIVTKEDYQNLMRAISTGNTNDADTLRNVVDGTITGLDVVAEDVTLGTTHFVDGEDIDPSEVIDTSGEEVHSMMKDETFHANTQPQQQQHVEYQHHHTHQPPPQQQQAEQHQQVATLESFVTYPIPQPPVEIQAQLQEPQYHQLQNIHHHQQHYQQQHNMMAYQQQHAIRPTQGPSVRTTSVPETVPEVSPQSGGWGFNDRRTTFIK